MIGLEGKVVSVSVDLSSSMIAGCEGLGQRLVKWGDDGSLV